MSDRQVEFFTRFSISLFFVCILFFLGSCSPPQRVSAQERMFRNFSLEFIDQYEIPKATYQNTLVGGLSAIAYNREQDIFYVLSDDQSKYSPARFYTFKLKIKQTDNAQIKLESFEPQDVTILLDENGKQYQPGSIDPEGLAISPRNTLFISSEGNPIQEVEPFIAEFELATGKKVLDVPLPKRYLSGVESPSQGIQQNLGFESLTINRTGLPEDPFRLFTATESALIQDESLAAEEQARIRFLHYVINPVGNPVLVAEHLYLLESAPVEVISNGLTELLALPTEGYFLSLERTFGFEGAGAKLFQLVIANATDTTNIASLRGNITQVQPLRKKLLFNLANLGIYLDNLEGMTTGPRLPDGSKSLLLISDDNFNDEQINQLLLFRLVENK